MLIAIPVVEGVLSMHFGHAREYSFFEVDDESKEIKNTYSKTPPAHAPGVLPAWLHEEGANVILAGGMGQRAVMLFQQNGIEVIIGAPSIDPEEAARQYLAGTLQTGQNICDH